MTKYSNRLEWTSIRRILKTEKRDVIIVVIYSVLASLLGLVVPLSSQAIVNAVALGVFSQQLVVLCIIVFSAMVATAVISVFERYVIDMIQRRMFVNTAFDIVYRLPHLSQSSLRESYGPELVNRFFDVVTIQKSVGKFLLGVRMLCWYCSPDSSCLEYTTRSSFCTTLSSCSLSRF